ncbi:MAG: acyl-CoA dehydratase activase-related protein [bacterium]|nr:acyl-CoA dehydratase activase-related protein [bacterium]
MKVGIPTSLLYYRYKYLWITYFTKLNCKIVKPSPTTIKTINLGNIYSPDETCLPYKIYMGQIYELLDKCNYIVVPRICSYNNKENVCVRFNGLYDNVVNCFKTNNILTYNIDQKKNKLSYLSFIKMGLKINKNIFKVINSYIKALIIQKKYNKNNHNYQEQLLSITNKKVLLVAHPYLIEEPYFSKEIINYLTNNNITILHAYKLHHKIAKKLSLSISPTLYWTYSKELIGAIKYYYEHIDGIIFLTTFPCGPDSLVNELMIRKIEDKPTLNLIIDESTSTAGLETRLESFLDIINTKEKHYE